MTSYYTYLLSSLPALRFGDKAPFTFNRFLEACRGLIPEEDLALIDDTRGATIYSSQVRQPTLLKWRAFDMALRNELVKIRASRRHLDPQKYLREDGESTVAINHTAINACRSPSIIEGERMLDEARWNAIDEISAEHYFDIDALLAYALKLAILEKWDKARAANGAEAIEGLLTKTEEESSHAG